MQYPPGEQLVAFRGAVAFAALARTNYSNRPLQTWTCCPSDLTCNTSLWSLDEEEGCPELHRWTPPQSTAGAEIQVSGGLLRDRQQAVNIEWGESVSPLPASKK